MTILQGLSVISNLLIGPYDLKKNSRITDSTQVICGYLHHRLD